MVMLYIMQGMLPWTQLIELCCSLNF